MSTKTGTFPETTAFRADGFCEQGESIQARFAEPSLNIAADDATRRQDEVEETPIKLPDPHLKGHRLMPSPSLQVAEGDGSALALETSQDPAFADLKDRRSQ